MNPSRNPSSDPFPLPASGDGKRIRALWLLLPWLALGSWLGFRESPAPASGPVAGGLGPALLQREASAASVSPVADRPDGELPPPLDSPATRPAPQPPQEGSVGERESFQQAVFTAMHAVEPLTGEEQEANGEVTHFAVNRGQKFNARFLKDGGVALGSSLEGKTWRGTLRAGSGAGGVWQADGVRAWRPAGAGLTEWYENRAGGMEHGFTLDSRPAEAGEKGFSLDVTLEGLLVQPDSAAEGEAGREGDLVFIDPETAEPVLAYRGLKVWDGAGRELASVMRPTAGGLRFTVRDEGALYPVTIDPLIVSLEEAFGSRARLAAPDPAANDGMGDAVALDGNTALVAGRNKDLTGAADAGVVYVFVRGTTGWRQQARLVASDPAANARFGKAVALAGDTALIGAPGAKAAYIFKREGDVWQQRTKLTGTAGAPNSVFGDTVALNGSTALVGDRDENYNPATSPNWGAVYVFVRGAGDSWTRHSRLTGTGQYFFGTCLALEGSTALIGAVALGGNPASAHNAVHVFARDGAGTWSPQGIISTPEPTLQEFFGQAVALDGDRALIGAPGFLSNPGSAYLFSRSGNSWVLEERLTSGSEALFQGFGRAVALDGSVALVGAINGGTYVGAFPGSVYVFYNSGPEYWNLIYTIKSWESEGDDFFGSSLALDGPRALIGAPGRTVSAAKAGAAFFRDLHFVTPHFPGAAAGDHTGLSVAVDGDTAVVGALDHDVYQMNRSGAAWVMQRSGTVWRRNLKLSTVSPSAGDRFGVAVAIAGDRIVVGADYDDEGSKIDCGSVTVFKRQGNLWRMLDRMTPAPAHSCLGRSVAISGSDIVAGAPLEEWRRTSDNAVLANDVGAVYRWYEFYLYDDIDWITSKISPGSVQEGSGFGFSVAVSGNRLAVGQPGLDGRYLLTNQPRSNIGLVSFFDKQYNDDTGPPGVWTSNPVMTWTQGLGEDLGVGFSLAMDGNTAVVGACSVNGWFYGSANNPSAGQAHVFTHNGTAWSSVPLTLPGSGFPTGTGAYYGSSVAVKGNFLAVGAFGGGSGSGRLRVFERQGTQWVKQGDLAAPVGDRGTNDAFGISAGLSGNTLLVGAYGVSAETGGAYVYRLVDPVVSSQVSVAGVGGNGVVSWPDGTGLALWRSPTAHAGSWVKITGSETATTYSFPFAAAPKMFFRLAPP